MHYIFGEINSLHQLDEKLFAKYQSLSKWPSSQQKQGKQWAVAWGLSGVGDDFPPAFSSPHQQSLTHSSASPHHSSIMSPTFTIYKLLFEHIIIGLSQILFVQLLAVEVINKFHHANYTLKEVFKVNNIINCFLKNLIFQKMIFLKYLQLV